MFSLLLLGLMGGLATRAAAIDAETGRLPNPLTAAVGVSAAGLLLAWAVLTPAAIPAASAAWLAVVLGHSALVLLPPYGLGAGDLKLIAGLVAPLAWWGNWWLWLGISYGLGLAAAVVERRRRGGWPRSIRLGPWLTTGWWAVVMGQLTHVALAHCG